MTSVLLQGFGLGFLATLIEEKLFIPSSQFNFLYQSIIYNDNDNNNNITTTFIIPRGMGITFLILIITIFWVFVYGFEIGKFRQKYKQLAMKDDEPNAEENYSYPNLYVYSPISSTAAATTTTTTTSTTKNSQHANAFNCVQRSHQHILETFPGYLLLSLLSSYCYPIMTSIICILWLYSRYVWCQGYATSNGDATKRYTHIFSSFFWKGFLAFIVMSIITCINIIMGKKKKKNEKKEEKKDVNNAFSWAKKRLFLRTQKEAVMTVILEQKKTQRNVEKEEKQIQKMNVGQNQIK